jgi:hypothetical protein
VYIHILYRKHNDIDEIDKRHIPEVPDIPGFRICTTICMRTCKLTFMSSGMMSYSCHIQVTFLSFFFYRLHIHCKQTKTSFLTNYLNCHSSLTDRSLSVLLHTVWHYHCLTIHYYIALVCILSNILIYPYRS